MIIFIGDPEDLTGAYLRWLAARRAIEVIVLDESVLGTEWCFRVEPWNEVVLRLRGAPIPIPKITGAVVRLNPAPPIPGALGDADTLTSVFLVSERRAGLQFLLDAVPFPVANRPSRGRSNGSKPAHMRALTEAEFSVPTWITTNDAARVRDLLATCPGGVVVKASSGLRSHVRLWNDDVAEAFSLGTAPHVVQRHIAGYDVRVHTAGTAVFATRVRSAATDYRFDGKSVTYSPCAMPSALAEQCVRHAEDVGLVVAGYDFRVDEGGEWHCLEMNPVPSFLPYEAGSGQQIGDAIIDLLAPGTSGSDACSPLSVFR